MTSDYVRYHVDRGAWHIPSGPAWTARDLIVNGKKKPTWHVNTRCGRKYFGHVSINKNAMFRSWGPRRICLTCKRMRTTP